MKKKLLIVEDEKNLRLIYREELKIGRASCRERV